jgi:iron complex transport system substrate-binding protein
MGNHGAIVSLLPAATEIVCALGAQDRLVAVSHECDRPAGVTKLPHLTASRVSGTLPTAEIHHGVEELVARALSIYEVDAAALKAAAPEVIISQTQCAVCAVTPDDLDRALEGWLGDRPQLVSLSGLTLDGIFADIEKVGAAIGMPDEAGALVARMRRNMAAIADTAKRDGRRPRVGVLEWASPPMGAGNWMPELLQMAGCEPAWGEVGAHSPWLSAEDVQNADPDMLVVIPCGYDLERGFVETRVLVEAPEWADLRAVREAQLFVADGNQFFNRPGPGICESLSIIFQISHPTGAGSPGEPGKWVRFSDCSGEAATPPWK